MSMTKASANESIVFSFEMLRQVQVKSDCLYFLLNLFSINYIFKFSGTIILSLPSIFPCCSLFRPSNFGHKRRSLLPGILKNLKTIQGLVITPETVITITPEPSGTITSLLSLRCLTVALPAEANKLTTTPKKFAWQYK